MIYRETGQFKTSYKKDMAIFPIRQDRWGLVVVLVFAVVGVPLVASDHVVAGYLIPFLIWAMAAIGSPIGMSWPFSMTACSFPSWLAASFRG